MANEAPHDTPLDPLPADAASEPTRSTGPTGPRSVWRIEWQWVALAWLGGIFVGAIFLMLAFRSQSDTQALSTMAVVGILLAIFPGLCATLQTWQGHRKSVGKESIWPWDKRR